MGADRCRYVPDGESMKKLLVVQAAALGCNVLSRYRGERWGGLTFRPMNTVFPAVTCSVQAAFRTALSPEKNGIMGNGFFDRKLGKVMFWEQSAALVGGERIWDDFRAAGKTVAMLFWQQSMGERADIILSPAPIHKHHGGMIQDCYSQPAGLYEEVCSQVGRPFDLKSYWGPMASGKSSRWIAEATAYIMGIKESPDLCLTYLPVLDYDLQRYGIGHNKSRMALDELFDELDLLKSTAEKNGYDIIVFGDYAIGDVSREVVYPNRILRDAGLMVTREIDGMMYPDFFASEAFAVVDHEVAHIYVKYEEIQKKVIEVLSSAQGVNRVMDTFDEDLIEANERNIGDLIAVAEEGSWFAYPWWSQEKQAPEYATHVDIHNKPGYDPCELFFGVLPWKVSNDTSRTKGSHGAPHPQREVCWASSFCNGGVESLLDLAGVVRQWTIDNRSKNGG